MHDKRFGLKVMIGIALGIALGLALTLIVPVGVQPGDVLRATLNDGTYVNVKITTAADDPKGTEPSTATVVEAEERDNYPSYEIAFASAVTVIGKSLENAQAELSRSAGVTFESAEVTKRDKVVVRPGATEIVYIVGHPLGVADCRDALAECQPFVAANEDAGDVVSHRGAERQPERE